MQVTLVRMEEPRTRTVVCSLREVAAPTGESLRPPLLPPTADVLYSPDPNARSSTACLRTSLRSQIRPATSLDARSTPITGTTWEELDPSRDRIGRCMSGRSRRGGTRRRRSRTTLRSSEISRGVSLPVYPPLYVGADSIRCAVVRILQARGVAFVTYVSELNAQFAKEAMSNQSLDEGEVINVRSVHHLPLSCNLLTRG